MDRAPEDLLEEVEYVARLAGEELRRRFGSARTVTRKGAIDLVTDADRAAEACILEALDRRFPGAAILAEESGARAGKGGLRFIVDPLDGTTNYAHGVPHFSVSLAAEDEGGLAAGVVFEPLREECFRAARGRGAFLGDRPIRASAAASLDEALLATGFPYDVRERPQALFDTFQRVLLSALAVRRFGSAALDLAWVAAGRYDGFWESGLQPWDMAAGILLVVEAGGTVTGFDGGAFDLARGELVASAAALHPHLLAQVREGADLP